MKTKIDAYKILDELMKASSSCIEVFGEKEELDEMSVNEVKNELKMTSKKIDLNDSKVYTFSNGQKKEVSNEVVVDHPECLLNVNMIDIDSRNDKNEVEIDLRFQYLDEMKKYMANEFDINELNGIEFVKFCRELMEMNIPFRSDIMNRLYTGYNEYGIVWKNRCVIMNGNEYELLKNYIQKVWKLSELKYNYECDRVDCIIDSRYEPIIQALYTYLEDRTNAYELHSLIEQFASTIDSKYDPLIQSIFNLLQNSPNADENHSLIDRKLLNSFINESLIKFFSNDTVFISHSKSSKSCLSFF